MPDVADWRDPSNYEPDDALDWPSIAMGYLARNEAYRADYADAVRQHGAGIATAGVIERLIQRWGITFPVDATGCAKLRDVIVPPDRCPIALHLVATANDAPSVTTLSVGRIFRPVTARLSNRGEYVVLHAPNGDHRLWLTAGIANPQALLLPFDEH